jgi:hypothetical protein
MHVFRRISFALGVAAFILSAVVQSPGPSLGLLLVAGVAAGPPLLYWLVFAMPAAMPGRRPAPSPPAVPAVFVRRDLPAAPADARTARAGLPPRPHRRAIPPAA